MKPCDCCGDRKSVDSCEVCGSQVCDSCKLEYGCKVCGGGKQEV